MGKNRLARGWGVIEEFFRSESCYMYERHDNNIYYFTALDKVIQFVVILSPESEIIKSINVIIDRKGNNFLEER